MPLTGGWIKKTWQISLKEYEAYCRAQRTVFNTYNGKESGKEYLHICITNHVAIHIGVTIHLVIHVTNRSRNKRNTVNQLYFSFLKKRRKEY